MRRARRGGPGGRLAVVAVAAVAVFGCSSDPEPPPRLLDGSPAQEPPVRLEGVANPTILTLARRATTARCVAARAPGARVLERIGVGASSVTIVDPARGEARACDSVEPAGPPCATAFGRMRRGVLEDARLTVTCETRHGPRAFAWVQPRAPTRYVAVGRDDWVEVYPVVSGVPVRITSDDVDFAGSARFRVAEHDRRGSRVASYVLVPRVAG